MNVLQFTLWAFGVTVASYMILTYSRSIFLNGILYLPRRLNSKSISQMKKTVIQSKERHTKNHFRDYFENIVLVIVYNHPHYDSIDMLRQFYGPVFPNIFICGPKSNGTHRNDITQLNINRGIFGYKCLGEAIRQNFMRNYDGYFYINDDVILNYWNLVNSNFDKNVIWSSNNQYGHISLEDGVPEGWYWWVSPYGFKNCKNAVAEIKTLAQRYQSYKVLWKQHLENENGTAHAYNGRSDIVYIPQKHALQFQELEKLFEKHLVFLEIAVPTILRFLAPSKEIQTLQGHYIPGDVRKGDPRVIDARYFWVTYLQNPQFWFIHPFKLHHQKDKNRELNLILMDKILIQKTRTLISNKNITV